MYKINNNNFKVIALMSAYNEEDIIYHTIGELIRNDIQVYLLDNRSSDNTVLEAEKWLGKGLISIEMFPSTESNEYNLNEYNWTAILKRKEELALELQADWFIHCDADEFRESPWANLNLREAFCHVDEMNFNCVNFILLNFRPTNNNFIPGDDIRKYLLKYDAADCFDTTQIKAWKKNKSKVDLSSTGGHHVKFLNQKLAPIKFILRHYPIRSELHGRKKVLQERIPRFTQFEVSNGWHMQYNSYILDNKSFLYKEEELTEYDTCKIRSDIMIQCCNEMMICYSLTGINVIKLLLTDEIIVEYIKSKVSSYSDDSNVYYKNLIDLYIKLVATQFNGHKDISIDADYNTIFLLYYINQIYSAYTSLTGMSRESNAAFILEKKLQARLQSTGAVGLKLS